MRQDLRQQLTQKALVLGEGIGVQQRDRHRLRTRVCDPLEQSARARAIERLQRTIGRHPLGHAEAKLRRHERRRRRLAQAVEVRAGLAAELDDVGEPLRGEQRCTRSAPLKQGVRRHGHTVREALHVLSARSRRPQHELAGLQHGDRLLGRRGEDLRAVHRAVIRNEHRVGERSADVDSQEHRCA